jgi:hypothetical protein
VVEDKVEVGMLGLKKFYELCGYLDLICWLSHFLVLLSIGLGKVE